MMALEKSLLEGQAAFFRESRCKPEGGLFTNLSGTAFSTG